MAAARITKTVGDGNSGTFTGGFLSSDGTGTGTITPAPTIYDSSGNEVKFGYNATSNGGTASRINSLNTTNATNLKASAGNFYEIDVFNNAAYPVYLKIYNKASSPTVGTDTPIWTIPIAAGTGYSKSFAYGFSMATGLSYAITKGQADSDTTAVLAGDLTGMVVWF
jgi:hypothetical protein